MAAKLKPIIKQGLQYLYHGKFDLLSDAKGLAKEIRKQGYRYIVRPREGCFVVYSNGGDYGK